MIKYSISARMCLHSCCRRTDPTEEGREGGGSWGRLIMCSTCFLKSLLAFATVSTNIFQFCAFRGQSWDNDSHYILRLAFLLLINLWSLLNLCFCFSVQLKRLSTTFFPILTWILTSPIRGIEKFLIEKLEERRLNICKPIRSLAVK